MRQPGRIHAANVGRSPRLQRFLTALRKAKSPMSTRTLQIVAAVCNPNSCAAELRAQGYQVEVERKGDLFFYSLIKPDVLRQRFNRDYSSAKEPL